MAEPGNCPKCDGPAQVMISTGGPCIYWRVECVACGFNSRGPGMLHGLARLGFGPSQNAPQNSREEALERWHVLRATLPTPAASAESNGLKPEPAEQISKGE